MQDYQEPWMLLHHFYDKFNDARKITLEEAIVKYLKIFNRALVEIMSEIPKSLYDILEMRRNIAKAEDDRLKEYVIVNIYLVITIEEVKRIIKESLKHFIIKIRINKIMIGK